MNREARLGKEISIAVGVLLLCLIVLAIFGPTIIVAIAFVGSILFIFKVVVPYLKVNGFTIVGSTALKSDMFRKLLRAVTRAKYAHREARKKD